MFSYTYTPSDAPPPWSADTGCSPAPGDAPVASGWPEVSRGRSRACEESALAFVVAEASSGGDELAATGWVGAAERDQRKDRPGRCSIEVCR